MDNTIKISAIKYTEQITDSKDSVWVHMIKTKYWNRKYTLMEWHKLLQDLKCNKPR